MGSQLEHISTHSASTSVLAVCGLDEFDPQDEIDMGSFASDDDVARLQDLEQEGTTCCEAKSDACSLPVDASNGARPLMRQFVALDDHMRGRRDSREQIPSISQKRKGLFSPPDKSMRKTASHGTGMDVDMSRFVKEAAIELQEPKVQLLRRAMDLLGLTIFRALLHDVQDGEENGGQRTATTSGGDDRRRTPGGVFWNLLKSKISKEEYTQIFAEEKEKERERNKMRQKERNLKRELEVNGRVRLANRLGMGVKPQSSQTSTQATAAERPWVSVVKAAGP